MGRIAKAKLEGTNAEDFLCTVTAKGKDPTTGEWDVINISALSITVNFKDKRGNVMVALSLSSGLSFVTDGTDGKFQIFTSAPRTGTWAPDLYEIGCIMATASGSLYRQLFVGQVAIIDGVG